MNTIIACKDKKKFGQTTFWKQVNAYKYYYLLLLLPLAYYLIFCYLPMYGATLAFKEFRYDKGIFNSPWVGMQYFKMLWKDTDFITAFANTLIISLSKVVFCFPLPIILALFINEIKNKNVKRFYQTVFTFPHFLSWIIVAGIITNLLSDRGAINQIISLFGVQPQSLLTDSSRFRLVIYISQAWKEMGWDSIIYLAALAGINPEMYEAANLDGANRLQMLRYITWAGIKSTVSIVLILAIGSAMVSNFDQIFNLYNPSVYKVADVLDTYVYRQAFSVNTDFSYASAVGLLKSAVSLVLVFLANFTVTRLFKEDGLV